MHTTHLIFLAVCACLFSTSSNGLSIKPGTKWNDPQIAVCWENPKNEHAQDRRLIRQAAETTWEKESAVTFTGWKACKEDSKGIRVSVARAHPRVLGRGTELDGLERGMILPPLWTLASMSVNMKASVHEFGHALGFGHEHARSDAPDPKRCGGFSRSGVRIIEDDVALTPFDIDSIMVACVDEASVARD